MFNPSKSALLYIKKVSILSKFDKYCPTGVNGLPAKKDRKGGFFRVCFASRVSDLLYPVWYGQVLLRPGTWASRPRCRETYYANTGTEELYPYVAGETPTSP